MKSLAGFCICAFLILVSCNPASSVDMANLDWLKLEPKDHLLTDRQKSTTEHNATILAFREVNEQDSTFIQIPENVFTGYKRALATIITSTAGQQYPEIHHTAIFDYRNLNSIITEPKPDAPFKEAWQDSIVTTGIPEIDKLLKQNGFKIASIHDWSFSENLHFVLSTETSLNTLHLSNLLEETGYFITAHMNGRCCDGSDIAVSKNTDSSIFTFINASGDCPAGCTIHEKYSFELDHNGSVTFLRTN